MRYTHFLIGIVIFSLVTFIFFNAAHMIGKEYSSDSVSFFSNATQNYNFIEEVSNETSEVQQIQNKTKGGFYRSLAVGVAAVDAALDSAKLITNSISTVDTVSRQAEKDLKINPIFRTAAIAIFLILVIIIILAMIMRFHPSTD